MADQLETVKVHVQRRSSGNELPKCASIIDQYVKSAFNLAEAEDDLLSLASENEDKDGNVDLPTRTTFDITPRVEILIHGGDVYDLPNAIAEIMDNSIQAGASDISVNLRQERIGQEKSNVLIIRDNGKGMGIDAAKHWACMGESDHLKDTHEADNDKHLLGTFGRYGVGAKRAAFSIGDEVTLITRTKDMQAGHVIKVLLSKNKLEIEKTWKAELEIQKAVDLDDLGSPERIWPSFTIIKIGKIRETHVTEYRRNNGQGSEELRRMLGHIYHYYIFGRGGNVRKQEEVEIDTSRQDDGEGQDTEDNRSSDEHETRKRRREELGSSSKVAKSAKRHSGIQQSKQCAESSRCTKEKAVGDSDDGSSDQNTHDDSMEEVEAGTMVGSFNGQRRLTISVDGVPISAEDTEDMETMYLSKAAATETFKVKVKSQGENKDTTVEVLIVMQYFPFKDGQETLPIPRKYCAPELGEAENAQTPLTARSPGFEVFWIGRLIPNEHLSTLPFTTPKKKDLQLQQPFHRVKGQIFLDGNVSVSNDKLRVTQHDPLWKNLTGQGEEEIVGLRQMKDKFINWLQKCHKDLDKDVVPEGEAKDLEGRSSYERVLIGSTRFQLGDLVQFKNKAFKPIGTLTRIYRDSISGEDKMEVTVSEGGGQSKKKQALVTALVSVLNVKEFRAKLRELELKTPTEVGLVGEIPRGAVKAGYAMKKMTFNLLNSDRKTVRKLKKEIICVLKMKYLYADGREHDLDKEDGLHFEPQERKPDKTKQYNFDLSEVKFTKAGTYRFCCSIKNQLKTAIKAKEVDIEVEADVVAEICPLLPGKATVIKTRLGLPFDITLQLKDMYGNGANEQGLDEQFWNLSLVEDGELNLEGLEVVVQEEPSHSLVALKNLSIVPFKFHLQTSCMIKLRISTDIAKVAHAFVNIECFAGPSSRLEIVGEDPFSSPDGLRQVENKTMVPPVRLAVLDNYKNRVDGDVGVRVEAFGNCIEALSPVPVLGHGSPQEMRGTVLLENLLKCHSVAERRQLFPLEGSITFRVIDQHTSTAGVRSSKKGSKQQENTAPSLTQKILVTPSQDPTTLFVMIPPDLAIESREEVSGAKCTLSVFAGTCLTGWEVHVLAESGSLVDSYNGELEVSWGETETPINIINGKATLPDYSMPTEAFRKKGRSMFPTTESLSVSTVEGLELTVLIKCIPGPPHHFGIGPIGRVTKMNCGRKFAVGFNIFDQFDNKIRRKPYDMYSEDVMEDGPEQRLNVKPRLEIRRAQKADEMDQEMPEPEEERHDSALQVCDDNARLLVEQEGPYTNKFDNLVVIGKVGRITVSVVDEAGVLGSESFNWDLIAGSAANMQVEMSSITVINNRGLLPPFRVTFSDEGNNKIESAPHGSKVMIKVPEGLSFENTVDSTKKPVLAIDEKSASCQFDSYRVSGTPGDYELEIVPSGFQGVQPRKVMLVVQPGSHAKSIVICSSLDPIIAGKPFPDIPVSVLAENGSFIQCDFVDVTLTCPGATSTLGPFRSFRTHDSSTTSCIVLGSILQVQTKKIGTYSGSLICHGQYHREGISWELETKFNVVVLPADGVALRVMEQPSSMTPVSNVADSLRRVLYENLKVEVVDKFGNSVTSCEFTVNLSVIKQTAVDFDAKLGNNSNNTNNNSSSMPKLDGDISERSINAINGIATFPRVSVARDPATTGRYQLCFSCRPLQSAFLDFYFADESSSQAQLYEHMANKDYVGRKLQEAQVQLLDAQTEVQALRKKSQQYDADLAKLRDDLYREEVILEGEGACPLEDHIKSFENRLAQIRAHKTDREAYCEDKSSEVVARMDTEEERQGVLGPVANLACVQDDRVDAAISTFVGHRMNAIVLKDNISLDKLEERLANSSQTVTLLSLDNVEKFQGERDEVDRRLLFNNGGEKFPGFKGVAVNMLQFKANSQEADLRATVFFAMLKDTLIFDTRDNAMEYRRSRIIRNKRCPVLLSLDGKAFIDPTGFVTVGARRQAQYHFGTLPLEEQDDYKSINHTLGILKSYMESQKHKSSLINEELKPAEIKLQELKSPVALLNAKIEKVSKEIEQLQNCIQEAQPPLQQPPLQQPTLQQPPLQQPLLQQPPLQQPPLQQPTLQQPPLQQPLLQQPPLQQPPLQQPTLQQPPLQQPLLQQPPLQQPPLQQPQSFLSTTRSFFHWW